MGRGTVLSGNCRTRLTQPVCRAMWQLSFVAPWAKLVFEAGGREGAPEVIA